MAKTPEQMAAAMLANLPDKTGRTLEQWLTILDRAAGEPATDRLEASGSFNAMVSHRVRVTDAAQVDDELVGWLKRAFDAS